MNLLLRLLAVALPALLANCAKPAYQARGYASYIADHYAGHMTSSGQPYHPQGLTAAHQTLPFGTEVKVKNNYNGRTVKVIINDRFPHYRGREINLSRAAAEYIQIPYMQMADVTVTAKTLPAGPGPATYTAPPPANYGSPSPAGYGAPPSNPSAPPPNYNSPPPGYGAPPAGYGTTAPPSGLPPPPPGYPQR